MAEDLLQETFLDIWRRPERYAAAQGSFCAWMSVIARNRSIDMLRRRRPLDPLDDLTYASAYDLAHDAEQRLMCDRARLLAEALSTEQKEALDLAFFEGLTHSEIAELTEVPLGTVKSRIRAGLSVLRKGLKSQINTFAA